MSTVCSRCGGALGRLSQCVLPGTGVPQLCALCGRVDEARVLLGQLSEAQLTPKERALVQSLKKVLRDTRDGDQRILHPHGLGVITEHQVVRLLEISARLAGEGQLP